MEGGRDGGGREWCEVRSEEEQELTHQGLLSLASAYGCWPLLSGHSSSLACSRLVGIHFPSSSFISVHRHASPLVGVRLHWWVVVSICAWWLDWWVFMFSVVVQLDSHGGL